MRKLNHVNPFLYVALIPPNDRVRVFLFEENVVYFHHMVWNAASMKRMFRSGPFYGDDAVKLVRRHGVNMSYQGIRDVEFMQEKIKLAGYRHAILEDCTD